MTFDPRIRCESFKALFLKYQNYTGIEYELQLQRNYIELLPIFMSALSKLPIQTFNKCEWQKINTHTQTYTHI